MGTGCGIWQGTKGACEWERGGRTEVRRKEGRVFNRNRGQTPRHCRISFAVMQQSTWKQKKAKKHETQPEGIKTEHNSQHDLHLCKKQRYSYPSQHPTNSVTPLESPDPLAHQSLFVQ